MLESFINFSSVKHKKKRIRQEIKRQKSEYIRALIEYQNKFSESEISDTSEEHNINLSEESEEDVNFDSQPVDFLDSDTFQLNVSPPKNYLNKAQESSNNDLLIFENDEEKQQYVIESIREWALEGENLSMRKLNGLLNRLHPVFPKCPKSYKTLLNTPSNIPVINFESGGQFWYKSIKQN